MRKHKYSINISISLRKELNPIISLIDPNLENLLRHTCVSCIALVSDEKEHRALAHAIRQVLFDLYALYNAYTPWILIDEKRIGKESCPVLRGLSCNDTRLDINDRRLIVDVDCDEIAYTCVLELA